MISVFQELYSKSAGSEVCNEMVINALFLGMTQRLGDVIYPFPKTHDAM